MSRDGFDSEIGLAGCFISPVVAAVTGVVGTVLMLATGMPLDMAARIALIAGVVGYVAAWIPYNVWPRLRGRSARRTANDVVGWSFLVVPAVVTAIAMILLWRVNR